MPGMTSPFLLYLAGSCTPWRNSASLTKPCQTSLSSPHASTNTALVYDFIGESLPLAWQLLWAGTMSDSSQNCQHLAQSLAYHRHS